jgi:spore germination protein YaaH
MSSIGLTFLLLLQAIVASSLTQENRTHVCVSSFTTDEQLSNYPWSTTTDLIQSISPITIDSTGKITILPTWPLTTLQSWAKGNNTRLWVGVRMTSKEDAAQFFASDTTTIVNAAKQLVKLVSNANYDGLQLDFEGLKIESKKGYETFVSSCNAAIKEVHIRMTTTVYINVLLLKESEPIAYDVRYLSSFSDGIFIMGYDMTWLHTKSGK